MAEPLTTPILRTAVNKPGTVYDAENTKRMFAEDWNAAGDALDNHEERIVDLEGDIVEKQNSFVRVPQTVIALEDGATPALNAALGDIFTLSSGGDRTIAVPTNATSGQKIIIKHYANGGTRTLALNTGAGGFRFGIDITTLTETASGKTDYIGCIYNFIDSKWDIVAYIKGY